MYSCASACVYLSSRRSFNCTKRKSLYNLYEIICLSIFFLNHIFAEPFMWVYACMSTFATIYKHPTASTAQPRALSKETNEQMIKNIKRKIVATSQNWIWEICCNISCCAKKKNKIGYYIHTIMSNMQNIYTVNLYYTSNKLLCAQKNPTIQMLWEKSESALPSASAAIDDDALAKKMCSHSHLCFMFMYPHTHTHTLYPFHIYRIPSSAWHL